MTATGRLLVFLRHLRLPFQLVLAPVFLVGWALSGAAPGLGLLFAFVCLHVGVYGGATAYNTFYDRDIGPISGMRSPPPPGGWERLGGLWFQIAGATGLASMDAVAGLVGYGLVAAGIAYSHPSIRWKARPWLSLGVVALGQGVAPLWLGLRLGQTAGGDPVPSTAWLAALASGLVLAGVYPLTQVFQIAEDAGRGDRTFAVHCGARASFSWARRVAPPGFAALAVALTVCTGHLAWLAVLAPALALPSAVRRWEERFDRQTAVEAHDWSVGLAAASAAALGIGAALEIAL